MVLPAADAAHLPKDLHGSGHSSLFPDGNDFVADGFEAIWPLVKLVYQDRIGQLVSLLPPGQEAQNALTPVVHCGVRRGSLEYFRMTDG